jgi:SIR2-like domain
MSTPLLPEKVEDRGVAVYNQPIVTAPVTLFLGAGASKPFGKMLMREFVDYLDHKKGFGGNTLFTEIVNTPEGRDLEHLFEELDEWSRKGYSQQGDFIQPRGGLGVSPEPTMRTLAKRAAQLQEDLRREVFNAYRDIHPQYRQELVRRFEALLEVFLEKLVLGKSPFVIFTTNYDPAIETYCQARAGQYRLCDGFVSQWNAGSPIWHRESIDQLQLSATAQKDIVLFKLHGSTSWFKRGTEFIKSDAAIYVEADASFENLLIYPAKKKVALDDPYFTGYDYFQRTLEHCKLCVVIGYSFRDYDALSRLRSAASYNPGLKLLVLDTQADSLCKRLREQGVVAEPLPKSFGAEAFEQDYLAAIKNALSNTS